MKYNGIVIISDLDGTLLNSERELDSENLEAIRGFIAGGGLFGVATGRMERTTLMRFPELPVNIPSVFYNGALIYDLQSGSALNKQVMPDGLDTFLQDLMDRYPDMGLEINADGVAYILRSNRIVETQLEREGLAGVRAQWDEVPKGWYKVLLAAENERLQVIREDLLKAGRQDIQVVFSEKQLIDIMARGVSKGKAVTDLRRAVGHGWKKVIAVGDQENDLDMLRAADIGIAVGNACTSVKEASNLVIKPHSVPCIPQVLQFIDTL